MLLLSTFFLSIPQFSVKSLFFLGSFKLLSCDNRLMGCSGLVLCRLSTVLYSLRAGTTDSDCFHYHQAIYRLEITRRPNACGALDGSDYREQFLSRDATRTRNHDALLAQVNMLNRLADEAGLPPFYDGEVSEDQPIRRQVADAILEFVRQVVLERI